MATAKRTAKQIAATKRMLAANRARRAGTKTPARKTVHHKKAAHAAPRSQVVVVRQAAPAAVHKPAVKRPSVKAKAHAAAGKAMSLGKGLIEDVAIPVLIGGGAASVIDVAYGAARQFIPASVVDHAVGKPAIKIGLGLATAIAAQHFGMKPKHAKAFVVGVGIVQVHEAINGMVSANTKLNLNGNAMTMGELAAVLPSEINGLEALGALAAGDASLGAVLPYMTRAAA